MTLLDNQLSHAPFRRLRPLGAISLIIYVKGVTPEKVGQAYSVIDSAKTGIAPRRHLNALGKIIDKTDKHPFCLQLQIVQQKALVAVETLLPVLQTAGKEDFIRKAKTILKAHTGARPTSTDYPETLTLT